MGENTKQIEREIDAEREALDRNLDELEEKARDLADWRTHYRNHPTVFLGAAIGTGVLLGVLSRRGGGHLPDVAGVADFAEPHGAFKAPREVGPRTRELLSTWENVTGALLGLGIAKVIDAVSDLLPGFRDQYEMKSTRVH